MAASPGERTPRLAIVAPSPAQRAGLGALLADEGLVILSRHNAVADAIEAGYLGAVDVLVVDPSADDVDVLVERAPDLTELRPLLLGPLSGSDRIARAYQDRPWGLIARDAPGARLALAARVVSDGLVVVDPGLLGASARGGQPLLATDVDDGRDLTPREREVLDLMAAGLANKQIAQRLAISEHTAKFHVAAILVKLGAQSRTEAGFLAARRGLLAL